MKKSETINTEEKASKGASGARTRTSFILEVTGEILLTAGLILGLFVGYKAILQDNLVGDNQTGLAKQYEAEPSKFIDPSKVDSLADIFGQMYVPRFGDKWTRLVAEGTRWHPVLNEIGIGHYRGTAMPGEKGNFAVAAHRGGFGGAFKEIHRLQPGDKVFLKTKKYWYVYKHLQTKIVEPTDTGVIRAVPEGLDGAVRGGRYMTFTSCTPIFVNTQRIVAWFELESKSTSKPPEMSIHGGN